MCSKQKTWIRKKLNLVEQRRKVAREKKRGVGGMKMDTVGYPIKGRELYDREIRGKRQI